jgi:hypothetical protein
MRRWVRVLRTPLGLAAAVLTLAVLVLAVVAPILWPTTRTPSTPATSWLGRLRTTGPVPTTWGATSSSAPWWRPGSRSSSPSPRP